MCESSGQQTGMTDGRVSAAVEFRFSVRRQVVVAVMVLVAIVAMVVLTNAALHRHWWRGLWLPLLIYALIVVPALAAGPRLRRQAPGLPVRLTDEGMEVAGPADQTLTAEWANIAHAYVHGRLAPYLVVRLIDPNRTRPSARPMASGGRWESSAR
jgi:hypothetical protein